MSNNYWEVISQFVEIKSPWLKLIGEKVKDNKGQILDYWRVEKDDSLIIITEYKNQLFFPPWVYRHGINQVTLDFAGGRVNPQITLEDNAFLILERELNLEKKDLKNLIPINQKPWIINSAFNNQKLWGFYSQIKSEINVAEGIFYSLTQQDLLRLLNDLTCIQCRSLLLESICQGIVAVS
ncbi:MAG: hypothetical protein GW795_04335 [Cyanobacteria bacterium]|nr:hypothetical protein [Cyanobacteria bacterium CG_2015-16_32_12]NCO78713.1 hypothetical protein [Cyanobacteria bacterium CG_2015-22_32_23]NCQ05735.1 hypothetical protein [Cyanobacteria bacterium CG_2015-09_32_10]NCQ41122.1 hypothetical protein [Cyanobacteria bacterium CG_2015-04_32_10]NCS85353.1 hypothetical protein [Cyanobacteria bacterium CG_2015-02_32_10]